eukprot:gene14653-4672_t
MGCTCRPRRGKARAGDLLMASQGGPNGAERRALCLPTASPAADVAGGG